jgi:uncharacterized repeat protein (TIGR01451 family)
MNTLYFRFIILLAFSAIALEKATGQCTSTAGTMDLTPLTVCSDTLANAIYDNTGEVLDPDDVLGFILHDASGTTLGNVLGTHTAPSFNFNSATMTSGTTYYISAVVGNDDGSGHVGLSDPCLSVAAGTPVVFTFLQATITVQDISCWGVNDGAVAVSVSGGQSPYTYDLNGVVVATGDETALLGGLAAGAYILQITDATGCSTSTFFVIIEPVPMTCEITGEVISCEDGFGILNAFCTGWVPPYTYIWSNGATSPATTVFPGIYSITIVDGNGCISVDSVEVSPGEEDCGVITGHLFNDDGDCLPTAGEAGLSNWLVTATATGGQEFYGFTDSSGNYQIHLLPGDYSIEPVLPNSNYWLSCLPFANTTLEDENDVDTVDFQLLKLVDCPLLEVDISTPSLRRCLNNTFYVNYCNLGTADAEDAFIEVTFGPLISVTSSSIPWSGVSGDTYTFDLGNVGVGDCSSFFIQANVSCDAVLGQTLCAEAHIFPDSLCIPTNPNWSGAGIQITSECTADSVIFTITNVGTGDMTEPSQFIVIEDGVMLMAPEEFTLEAGGAITISFPANGSTYVLQANQVNDFPGLSNPLLAVEGCGTNGAGAFSTGFFTQFPENDGDPFISIDCHEVIGSYDPNDKYGFPKGYGDEYYIEPGQVLDYHVRFQNTGTDTAFNVTVEDVLSPFLDITTLRPGASSHPYKLEIHGSDTLVFIFENILLPDSNVNEAASHGFVKFRIGQKAGNPLGTVIENNAAIFFDFNEPVVTNTTLHKLGEHFILTTGREPQLPVVSWAVFPNPFSEMATVAVQGAANNEAAIRLYDLTGRMVRHQSFTGGVIRIQKESLPPGLYFYEILLNGMPVGNGKLAVE